MDPLSDVLSLLRPRNYLSAAFDAGSPWSIQFPDQQGGIKCNAVVSGECWVQVEGVADALLVKAGDFFLLPSGRPFRLASDLDTPPVAAETVFADVRRDGRTALLNGGGDFFAVSSRFALSGDHADMLLGMLPPIVHIRKESDQAAALRWSIEQTMQELRGGKPGSFLLVQHLAHMMLLQALRLHLNDRGSGRVGWLFALADRQIGQAIGAMHGDPAHRWTLQELAAQAAMSRSTFALRFKAMVGSSPMEYLTRWRMLLAADRLTHSADPVSAIAHALGYESESAFSTAFRRAMGCSPRQYGRIGSPALAPDGEATGAQTSPERSRRALSSSSA
ncbi:AraC family transcriptional regulator [Kaistia algarum]|uniref:AraC family transcriptional regulator n=1 Tax=Kaistia algarum TaxID=2083279 RepID=UPI000CE8AE8F|nr:AraC family transcriptional regulator [Kaistia algarum]MCX5514614.1 AraC family transcriptional regulator [Kaistia algarum]PPE78945.1 AraC family transcriptional regulator [Kaistia algarum]